MAVADSPILNSLVNPSKAQEFLKDFWPKRVFHAHGPLARLPALFSSTELMSFRALAAGYQGWLGFGRGSEGARMVSVQQVSPLHLYEMGLSVYLPDISMNVQGAESFLRQLENDLGVVEGCSRITVWASPKADGAPTHFDGEDVFSIQLTGTKKFEVAPMTEYSYPYGPQFGPGAPTFDDMYPQLEKGFPDASNVSFEAINMKPGSVLFIPRGTWHRTTAEQDSFAISIGIRPPSVMDSFMEQLRYLLLQHPEWRRPLYGAYGSTWQRQEALERAQKLVEELPDAIRSISVGDLAPMPLIDKLKSIALTTRFQREPGTRIDFERAQGAEILRVKSWSRDAGEQETLKLSVPPQILPAFKWLAESKVAFMAGELADRFPEVPFEQVKQVLDVLTRAKYLRLLWFPQLAAH